MDLLLQLTSSRGGLERVWILSCAVLLVILAHNGAAQKVKRKKNVAALRTELLRSF